MNIYKITSLELGQAKTVLYKAYDIQTVLGQCNCMISEIIKIELVGSDNIEDYTNKV